jgi:hypothetical protein
VKEENLIMEGSNCSSGSEISTFPLSMLKLMDLSISDVNFAVLFILPNCLESSSLQNVISTVSME